jgi:23S rRNA (cytosine1962-C5)-methyltransferase
LRDLIASISIEVLNPKGINEKSDEKSREKEGLETVEKVIYGNIPNEIEILEYDAKILANRTASQ